MIDIDELRERADRVTKAVLDQRRRLYSAGGTPWVVLMSDDDHDALAAVFALDQGLDRPVPCDRLYGMQVGRFAGWEAGTIVVTEGVTQRRQLTAL